MSIILIAHPSNVSGAEGALSKITQTVIGTKTGLDVSMIAGGGFSTVVPLVNIVNFNLQAAAYSQQLIYTQDWILDNIFIAITGSPTGSDFRLSYDSGGNDNDIIFIESLQNLFDQAVLISLTNLDLAMDLTKSVYLLLAASSTPCTLNGYVQIRV